MNLDAERPTIYTLVDASAIRIAIAGGRLLLVFKGLAEKAGYLDDSELAVELKPPEAAQLAALLASQAALVEAEPQPKTNVTFLPPSPSSSSSH